MYSKTGIGQRPAHILERIASSLPISPLVAAVILTGGYEAGENVMTLEVIKESAFCII